MTFSDALLFLVILAGFGLCLAIGVSAIRDARRQR
jgi:hypothetical protein